MLALALGGWASFREPPPRAAFQVAPVDAAWYAALPRDPDAATRVYLDRIPAEQRARGDAHVGTRILVTVLQLVVAIAAVGLLLFSGGAARLRDRLERLTRRRWLQDAVVRRDACSRCCSCLRFRSRRMAGSCGRAWPDCRRSDFRSGSANEALRWAIDSIFYVAGIVAIMALVRWRPQRWPLYAVAVYFALYGLFVFVSPVAIEPLFNRYDSLAPGPARDAILSLARANGVPAEDVYVRDASRQGRVPNANVTGLGYTTRITLDDTTMANATSSMFRLVMAHEIGHYALGHTSKEWVSTTLVWAAGFAFIAWGMRLFQRRFGERWGIPEPANTAAIAVFWALFLVVGFLALPALNSIHRVFEREADLYGLNASREPHGLAEFMVQVSDAVKFEPSALEEVVFHTHPSPVSRVRAAMRWRAEQPPS